MMNRILKFGLLVLTISLTVFHSVAQDHNIAYYNQHPAEILPDAQTAFNNANYGRVVELCKWHFIIVGDIRADALKEKAERCLKLSDRIVELRNAGKVEEVSAIAKELLALNPDDRLANELNNPGILKVTSSPSGATIWLNGENTHKTTPELLEDMTPGKNTIKLVLEGYEDYTGTITITPGKRTDFSQTLTLIEKLIEKSTSGTLNGHDWVDLGLPSGLKWATCNVGASSPSDYGSYFAWGEISQKNKYTWENFKFRVTGDSRKDVTFSKYNTDSKYGAVDNKKKLDMSDDAARQSWGSNWRMPTDGEMTELREKCTWTWTKQGGRNGYRVTSKTNGNSIFLPAAGFCSSSSVMQKGSHGVYWSSSLNTGLPYLAWYMYFSSDGVLRFNGNRCLGLSVRPVTE